MLLTDRQGLLTVTQSRRINFGTILQEGCHVESLTLQAVNPRDFG